MARRTWTVSEPRLRQQTQSGRVSQNLPRGPGSPESARPQHQVPLFPGNTGNLSLLTCQLQLLLTPGSGSLSLKTDARLVTLESGGQVPYHHDSCDRFLSSRVSVSFLQGVNAIFSDI